MAAGNRSGQSGFTLIELLVTIAVIVIMATIAVPNFRGLIERNQLSADFNHMLSGINFARSEAVKRRTNVSVDISDADGANPWKLVVEAGASGAESTVRVIQGRDTSVSVTPFGVGFNALGRRASCSDGDETDAIECSLEMKNTRSAKLFIEASGNIARP